MTQFTFKSNMLFADAAQPSAKTLGDCQVVRFINGVKTVVASRKATKPHTINIVELCGIYEAAKYATKENLAGTIIYTDSLTAYSWVKKGKPNIKRQSELKEYELFVQKTGELKEVKFGDYYEIDEYRKSKGLGIRKKEGGKTERISNPNYESETELANKMLDLILKSNVQVLLWDTQEWGENPADFGRKAV